MTDPKITDPIVFNYQKSHIKLLANRLTLNTNKQSLTWRQANITEDISSAFSYKTDTTNLRASDQLYVTLNKPGVYQITANACHDLATGVADAGLTIDVAFPAATFFEIAYGENNITNFDTVAVSIPFRVLPSQVGTKISINAKATSGSPSVRGYNYSSSAFDAGAEGGSWVDILYQGP